MRRRIPKCMLLVLATPNVRSHLLQGRARFSLPHALKTMEHVFSDKGPSDTKRPFMQAERRHCEAI